MITAAMSYLRGTGALLAQLADEQADVIDAAALAVAHTLGADGLVHMFGSGHSHVLALEGFYRAGGLGAVNPILLPSLMLHANAALSTTLERTPGTGTAIFRDLAPRKEDTLIVISNSGRNVVAVELATAAREHGLQVIALLSTQHTASGSGLRPDGVGLENIAHIVIDNLGAAGDASSLVPGVPHAMGPTSTVTGAAIINAVMMSAAEIAARTGTTAHVYSSSNMAGGDALNAATIERYRGRVRAL